MFAFSYPAHFRPDEDGRLVVSFPDLPHAHTDGANRREALEEAIDCLGSVLAQYLAEHREIPAPSQSRRGAHQIPVPLWLAPKLALHLAMREQSVNNSELARRLEVRETVVRRLLDPHHASKPEKVQSALRALGKACVVTVCDAA